MSFFRKLFVKLARAGVWYADTHYPSQPVGTVDWSDWRKFNTVMVKPDWRGVYEFPFYTVSLKEPHEPSTNRPTPE